MTLTSRNNNHIDFYYLHFPYPREQCYYFYKDIGGQNNNEVRIDRITWNPLLHKQGLLLRSKYISKYATIKDANEEI